MILMHTFSWNNCVLCFGIIYVSYMSNDKKIKPESSSFSMFTRCIQKITDSYRKNYQTQIEKLYVWMNLYIYSSLTISPTSTSSPIPQPPNSFRYTPLFPFRKEQASLPGIKAKHIIRCYNRTRDTPLYKAWMKHHNRRKRIPKTGERVRNCDDILFMS